MKFLDIDCTYKNKALNQGPIKSEYMLLMSRKLFNKIVTLLRLEENKKNMKQYGLIDYERLI